VFLFTSTSDIMFIFSQALSLLVCVKWQSSACVQRLPILLANWTAPLFIVKNDFGWWCPHDSCVVWKCWYHVAPRHLVDLCVPTAATAGRRQSRSAVSGALMVPWTRTSTSQCSLAVYGHRTWNRLPPALQLPALSLPSFKRQLKTHLFQH